MMRRPTKRALRIQVTYMRKHLLEMADLIDELRLANEQLKLRGDRLVEALDRSDGTIESAWRVGDAVSAWQEYGGQ